MNNNNHQITTDAARSALESLEVAKKITIDSMRPPLWLTLISSLLLGIQTLAFGLSNDSILWHNIEIVSSIAFWLYIISWVVTLRIKGISVKFIGVNIAKKVIVSMLLIFSLYMASLAFYNSIGLTWFPYVAGILNTLISALSVHFYLRLNGKQKENNYE